MDKTSKTGFIGVAFNPEGKTKSNYQTLLSYLENIQTIISSKYRFDKTKTLHITFVYLGKEYKAFDITSEQIPSNIKFTLEGLKFIGKALVCEIKLDKSSYSMITDLESKSTYPKTPFFHITLGSFTSKRECEYFGMSDNMKIINKYEKFVGSINNLELVTVSQPLKHYNVEYTL